MEGTYSFIYCHVLASDTLPQKLKTVLNIFVNTINWIMGHALNQRLFKPPHEDIGSENSFAFSLTSFFQLTE